MSIDLNQSDLKQKVHRVRRLFVTDSVPPRLLASLYQAFNPVEDISNFLATARTTFPALNCGLASVYLRHTLATGHVVTGTYNGHLHTFLLLGNSVVVDITADQFGGPSVYIGPLRAPWSLKSHLGLAGRHLDIPIKPLVQKATLWRTTSQ